MARIHVCLNLEHESGEAIIGRPDDPGIARPRLRWRRQLDERLKERLEAEVGQRAAKKYRRLASRQIFIDVEWSARFADDVQRLAKLRVRVSPDDRSEERRVGDGCRVRAGMGD